MRVYGRASALGNTLQHLQRMESVTVERVIGDCNRFLQLRASRHFDWRSAPCGRYRGSRHKGNLHPPSGLIHRLRLGPRVREMFVDKDRCNLSPSLERCNGLVEESLAGIEVLPLLVLRIT